MKFTLFILTLALAVLVVGCQEQLAPTEGTNPSTGEVPGSLQKAQVSTYPLEYVDYSPCTNEDILFTGQIREVFNVVFQNGHLHINQNQSGTLRGVGLTSGRQYISTGPAVLSYNVQLPGSAPFTYRITWEYNLITPGSTSNTLWKISVVYHVNANGVVLADYENWFTEFRCTN